MQTLRRRNKRDRIRCNVSAVRLLLIGVLFIGIGLAFAAYFNEIVAAIVSTIGSFSVWEAAAHWIEELPVLQKKDRILQWMEKAEIHTEYQAHQA